jgi:hypothetical protein
MPAGSVSVLGRTKKQKALFDNFTDFVDSFKFEFDVEWVKREVEEMQASGPNISPEEVDSKVDQNVVNAFSNVQIAESDNSTAVLSKSSIESNNIIETYESDDLLRGEVIKAAAIFAFTVGSINDSHYWIKIGQTNKKNKKNKYFGLNLLNETGKRSNLVHYFRNQISSLLEKGIKNKLILTLERMNKNPTNVKYLFTKGHLLNPDKRFEITKDINLIFNIINNKDNNKRQELADKLQFFV